MRQERERAAMIIEELKKKLVDAADHGETSIDAMDLDYRHIVNKKLFSCLPEQLPRYLAYAAKIVAKWLLDQGLEIIAKENVDRTEMPGPTDEEYGWLIATWPIENDK